VRILSLVDEGQRLPQAGAGIQREITGEATTYASAAGLFRLFRLKDIPVQEHILLLQVLRRGIVRNQEQFLLTDELPLSIEFRHYDSRSEEGLMHPSSPLIAGMNQVVIDLNEEGTPVSFRIDGAES
jgi:hypothetical protein